MSIARSFILYMSVFASEHLYNGICIVDKILHQLGGWERRNIAVAIQQKSGHWVIGKQKWLTV